MATDLIAGRYVTPTTTFAISNAEPGPYHNSTAYGELESFVFGKIVLDLIPEVLLTATQSNYGYVVAAYVDTENMRMSFDTVEVKFHSTDVEFTISKSHGDDYIMVTVYEDHADFYIDAYDTSNKEYNYNATIPGLTLSTLFSEENRVPTSDGVDEEAVNALIDARFNINDDKYVEVQRRYLNE